MDDLAIIIPTLNEEKYIGTLLESIASQTLQPEEIVIVDAYSQDKTKEEVLKWQKKLPQLKFFQIEKSTISRQRNFGSKKTTSKNILFLDADTKLENEKTLEKYLEEVNKLQPDLAVAKVLPLSDYWKDKLFFKLARGFMYILKNFWPAATGMNLYLNRKMFNKVKGFDEDIKVGEDMELVQRVVRNGGKFLILKNPKIFASVRRFEKEGRRNFILKMAKSWIYVLKHGYKNIPIEYELGNHR